MIRYLLPKDGNFYKANLHCHTTVSDGKLTPAEVKALYQSMGYSVVAYTDHDVMVPHPELADDNFLPLLGYEVEITEKNLIGYRAQTTHLCFISLKENPEFQPNNFKSPNRIGGNRKYFGQIRYDRNVKDFTHRYCPEQINRAISLGRNAGFFVTYNHPAWSLEGYRKYSRYEGMNAMEIVNYGCITEGYDDYNGKEYDELLHQGKQIFAVAADDNHNHGCDSGGGFVVFKAPCLTYEAIASALEKGEFYASEGPEIHDYFFDEADRTLHITCSPAVSVRFTVDARCTQLSGQTAHQYANDEKKQKITEAVYHVPYHVSYVRATVTDEFGRKADTNPLFLKC